MQHLDPCSTPFPEYSGALLDLPQGSAAPVPSEIPEPFVRSVPPRPISPAELGFGCWRWRPPASRPPPGSGHLLGRPPDSAARSPQILFEIYRTAGIGRVGSWRTSSGPESLFQIPAE